MEDISRRNQIYEAIPKIRQLDDEIAHISVEKTRYMLLHPGTDKKDELHKQIHDLSMEKINLLALHGYPADYLDPVYTCPACKDTGYIGSRRCACFGRYVADILWDQSNLQDILATANFESFRLDYYSDSGSDRQMISPRQNIRDVLGKCRVFLEQFDKYPGQNLFIHGHAGVGKTFLSGCIAGELLKREKSVVYLTAYQFFHHLEEYTFHREEADTDKLSWLPGCDLLIIDDLGTELNNAFINSRLFLCINERILKKKSTIINTNLSLEQISRTYTERVSSRIIESYQLLHIYGEDIRIKKAVSSE